MEAHGEGLNLLSVFYVYRHMYFRTGICRRMPLYIKACFKQFTASIWFLYLLTHSLELIYYS